MRVYKIEYLEYEYQTGMVSCGHGDWFLTPSRVRHVMAKTSVEAVELLRSDIKRQIEIRSIDHICKVDIKK